MSCATGSCPLPSGSSLGSASAAGSAGPAALSTHAVGGAALDSVLSLDKRPYRGLSQTMDAMRGLVRRYRAHPVVRRAALDALREAGLAACNGQTCTDLHELARRDPYAVAVALWNYVVSRIHYAQDPHAVELVQSPDLTLSLAMGDCDDLTVLIESMGQALGLKTRAVVVGYDARGWDHVWPELDVSGESSASPVWLAVDATLAALGIIAPGATRARVYDADSGLVWSGPADALHLEDFPTITDDPMDGDGLGNPFASGSPFGGMPGSYTSGFNALGSNGFGGFAQSFLGQNSFGFDGFAQDFFGFGQTAFGSDALFSDQTGGGGGITPERILEWLGVADRVAQIMGWGSYGGGPVRSGHVLVRNPNGTLSEVPRGQAEQLEQQGVLTRNQDGSYVVNPQAWAEGMAGTGYRPSSGIGLGTIALIAGVGLAAAFAFRRR